MYGAIPSSQPAFTDAKILNILSDELWTTVVPFLQGFQEEYYIRKKTYTVATGTSEYAIPGRTIGGTLRDVRMTPNGETVEIDWPRLDPQRKDYVDRGYYLEDHNVVVVKPENYNGWTLNVYYYLRPAELVLPSACAQVSSISGNDITVTTVPSSWTSPVTLDAMQALPPFKVLDTDDASTFTSNIITMTSAPSGLAVGDYLSLTGESCIPQIPLELHNMLVQLGIIRFAEILGYDKRMQTAIEKYRQIEESARNLMAPRVPGELKTFANDDGFI
jgi:hypothetical protein